MKISQDVIAILKNGGVGVLPTDTIYGLVGSALNKKAVGRIYKLKKRSPRKPFIILISDIKDLKIFGFGGQVGDRCAPVPQWPGPVSVILKCSELKKELSYLHPLNKTIAFRCPNVKWLNVLLEKTGPLIAPSANPEDLPPAQTIKQAKKYFNSKVDFYVDAGMIKGLPSTLISFENGKIRVSREGKIKIKNHRW